MLANRIRLAAPRFARSLATEAPPAGCPFSKASMDVVKATVPILESGGEVLTRSFYKRMFTHDPAVKAFFNPAHQVEGTQPRALADSVLAYAKNLDNLGALGPAIELIAQKHVALDIKAEHYPIVGKNLLAAMVEVLGKETANEAVINAWAEAYGFLADVLIARESAIYKELESQPHGWIGKRQFTVTRKIRKSDFICSLSLRPTDGLPLPPHRAGQYTTVYPGDSMDAAIPRPIAPRNYSISSPPGSAEWRITIKREVGADGKPNGLYSNWIHDHVKEGDVLNLGPAVGNFFLDEAALKKRPAIFLGAGVGLTPLLPMAMIATRVAPEQKIWWFYSASNSDYHPLVEQEIEEKALMNPNIKTVVAYDHAKPDDHPDFLGRYTPNGILHMTGLPDPTNVDIYVCGPHMFMAEMVSGFKKLGVPDANIHFEFFGPLRSTDVMEVMKANKGAEARA